MPKYLLLKHYRGGPEPHRPVPRWTSGPPRTWRRTWPSLSTSASCLRRTASTSTRRRSRRRAPGCAMAVRTPAPVTTDGPLPETSDLVVGWYLIEVESHARAVELAAYVSSEPGPGGEPLYEWVDVREVMSEAPGRGRMPPRLSRGHG